MNGCRKMPTSFLFRMHKRMKRKPVEMYLRRTIQLYETLSRTKQVINLPPIQTDGVGRQSRMMHFQPVYFGIAFQKLLIRFRFFLRQAESNGVKCYRRSIMRTDIRHHNALSFFGRVQMPFNQTCATIQRTPDVPLAPHISLNHLYI